MEIKAKGKELTKDERRKLLTAYGTFDDLCIAGDKEREFLLHNAVIFEDDDKVFTALFVSEVSTPEKINVYAGNSSVVCKIIQSLIDLGEDFSEPFQIITTSGKTKDGTKTFANIIF